MQLYISLSSRNFIFSGLFHINYFCRCVRSFYADEIYAGPERFVGSPPARAGGGRARRLRRLASCRGNFRYYPPVYIEYLYHRGLINQTPTIDRYPNRAIKRIRIRAHRDILRPRGRCFADCRVTERIGLDEVDIAPACAKGVCSPRNDISAVRGLLNGIT